MKRTLSVVGTALAGFVMAASVQAADLKLVTKSTQTYNYTPTIWVDPDGCEHWVMDDGVEGYMTPHVTRDGIPVCRRGQVCKVLPTDQLFKVDRAQINSWGRKHLMNFFQNAGATSYIIEGHTDSDASDAYNMNLSQRRAVAVSEIARSMGVNYQTRWYGERHPRASNSTSAGKQQNRRVEIICVR